MSSQVDEEEKPTHEQENWGKSGVAISLIIFLPEYEGRESLVLQCQQWQ